jgi:hypothetical protein
MVIILRAAKTCPLLLSLYLLYFQFCMSLVGESGVWRADPEIFEDTDFVLAEWRMTCITIATKVVNRCSASKISPPCSCHDLATSWRLTFSGKSWDLGDFNSIRGHPPSLPLTKKCGFPYVSAPLRLWLFW